MPIAARSMRPWSRTDLKVMKSCARKGLSARLAAARLRRSRGAVAWKAMVSGVSFHAINQPKGVQKRRFRTRR